MYKRILLIAFSLLLVSALWLAPVHSVVAQEDTAAAEVEESDASGPGVVILLVGLGAVLLVGFAYSSRQRENA